MNRAALLILTAIAAASALLPDLAAAKSKAYCRQVAEDAANRSAGGADVGATAGNVLSTMGEVLVGTVTANQALPAPTADGKAKPAQSGDSSQRQKIYRRAYADCRAS